MNGRDELLHYGVLGMKWGVRKDRKPSGGIRKKLKNTAAKMRGSYDASLDYQNRGRVALTAKGEAREKARVKAVKERRKTDPFYDEGYRKKEERLYDGRQWTRDFVKSIALLTAAGLVAQSVQKYGNGKNFVSHHRNVVLESIAFEEWKKAGK